MAGLRFFPGRTANGRAAIATAVNFENVEFLPYSGSFNILRTAFASSGQSSKNKENTANVRNLFGSIECSRPYSILIFG
jgi:hypothetical protein